MSDLAERIVRYRAKHNLSQVEFASICKVTGQTISNIERGAQEPSKLTLAKILNTIEKEQGEEKE